MASFGTLPSSFSPLTVGALARHDDDEDGSNAAASVRFLPENASDKFRQVMSHYHLQFAQIKPENSEHVGYIRTSKWIQSISELLIGLVPTYFNRIRTVSIEV